MTDYREMASNEIHVRMPEISKLYKLNHGFTPYKERIDVDRCRYCTADSKIWSLNGCFLEAGIYNEVEEANSTSCSNKSTGICRVCMKDKSRYSIRHRN